MTHGKNHWNPPRLVSCCCGWVRRFPTLRAANVGSDEHIAEGCEGCDHVTAIEEAQG
jgi:hypothetical protein